MSTVKQLTKKELQDALFEDYKRWFGEIKTWTKSQKDRYYRDAGLINLIYEDAINKKYI